MIKIKFPVFCLIALLLFSISVAVFTCKKPGSASPVSLFAGEPKEVSVQQGLIDEVSGIADSRNNDGYLWAEEDGGNPTQLHLLKHDGTYFKSIFLKGVVNTDWEEMLIGTGAERAVPYIYLADIGDNNAVRTSYNIYRFPEPLKSVDTISSISKINFQYPDGAHDAEAMMMDNVKGDLYVITKRDASSIIYKIPAPQSLTNMNQAVRLFDLPFTGAVAAAVSPDQKEIIIKTYTHLYYWQLKAGETLEEALRRTPQDLAYQVEPQGEAVCFKKDGSGFFTLSEKGFAASVFLNFYKRN